MQEGIANREMELLAGWPRSVTGIGISLALKVWRRTILADLRHACSHVHGHKLLGAVWVAALFG